MDDSSIILGVDPGTRVSGYGIIQISNRSYQVLDYGCIRPPVESKLSDRYHILFTSVLELCQSYGISVCVVETQFVHKNVQSALKLGMARGAVILAAKQNKLPIYQYAPSVAKRAVVGNGRAHKEQVKGMVQRLLSLPKLPPEDAADALALAICFAHTAAHLREKHEI